MSLLGAMNLPCGCGGQSRQKPQAAAVGKTGSQTNAPPAVASVTPARTHAPPAAIPQTGPQVRITSPLKNEQLDSTDVGVFLQVKDLPVDCGAHVHVILDDLPPEEVTDFLLPVVFRRVGPGLHVLRAFACDAAHVSYKNPAALAMVWFKVTDTGEPAVAFDAARPTLTFNLPLAGYRKAAGKGLPVDFIVSGPVEPGAWRVRVMVDGEEVRTLDRVDPAFMIVLAAGDHAVRLELLDAEGRRMNANFAWSERTVRVK